MSLSWRWQRRPGRAPSKGNLTQPRRLCSTRLGATRPCASRSSVDSCTPSCTRPLANGPNGGGCWSQPRIHRLFEAIFLDMAKRDGPRTPVVLIVLDGWGFRPGREGNAVELGRTPTWHRLWAKAPRTLLNASGLAVGLPEGQIGNSEVGHLNLGAGRVVPQDIVRISQAIESAA